MSNQEMTANNSELRELIKDFTAEQLRFVAARPFVRSDREAAERIGRSVETVWHWENKAQINEAVRLMTFDGAIVAAEILRRHVPAAAQELGDELDHNRVEIRHKAATQILDRAGVPMEQKLSIESSDGPLDLLAETVEALEEYRRSRT